MCWQDPLKRPGQSVYQESQFGEYKSQQRRIWGWSRYEHRVRRDNVKYVQISALTIAD